VYDGTRFWIYANAILDQFVTLNVANNADFDALFVALGRKRILTSGYVTVKLAQGTYTPLATQHPNADRMAVEGTLKTTLPSFADFARTGSSAPARTLDA